jgi:hypothetical protein
MKRSKERIPPFLAENEDLHKQFVRHSTNNLNNLTIDLAKEYVTETLIPLGFPLTEDFSADDRKVFLQWTYSLSETPARSTIWEWLTRCGLHTKQGENDFSLIHMNDQQTENIERSRQHGTYVGSEGCTAGFNSH